MRRPGWPRGRWRLPAETGWYLLPFLPVTLGDPRPTPGVGELARAGLPGPVAVVPLLVVLVVALARWWTPPARRAGFAVAGLGILVAAHLAGVVAGAPLFELAAAVLGVVPVLTVVGVRYGRAPTAAAVAVLALAAVVLDYAGYRTPVLDTGAPTPSVPLGVFLPALATAVVPIVLGLALRGHDARLRTRELARIRAQERALVARELHDMVAGHVTGIVVAAQAVGMTPDLPDRAAAALEGIESSGNEALAAMRRMVRVLRADPGSGGTTAQDLLPTSADDLAGAVRSAVDEDLARTDVQPDPGPELPADVLTTVHRIVTEALTNVRRHAPAATDVLVTVRAPAGGPLTVAVTNDGVPRRPSRNSGQGGGYGLVGVRERLAALGGEVETGPDGPGRWALRATLPFPRVESP